MSEIADEKQIVKASGISVRPGKAVVQSKLNCPTQAQINGQWQHKDKSALKEKKWNLASPSTNSSPIPTPLSRTISKKFQDISSKLYSPTSASVNSRIEKLHRVEATEKERNVTSSKIPSPLSAIVTTTATATSTPNDPIIPIKIIPAAVSSRPPLASTKKYSDVQSRLHVPTASCLHGRVAKRVPTAEGSTSNITNRPSQVLTSTTRPTIKIKPSKTTVNTTRNNPIETVVGVETRFNLPRHTSATKSGQWKQNDTFITDTSNPTKKPSSIQKKDSADATSETSQKPLSVVKSIKSTEPDNFVVITTSDAPMANGGHTIAEFTDTQVDFDCSNPTTAVVTLTPVSLDFSNPAPAEATDTLFGLGSSDSAIAEITDSSVGLASSDSATARVTDAPACYNSSNPVNADDTDAPVGLDSSVNDYVVVAHQQLVGDGLQTDSGEVRLMESVELVGETINEIEDETF